MKDQLNLKFQRLRILVVQHLVKHFLILFEHVFEKQWDTLDRSEQKDYFDEVFKNELSQNLKNKKNKKTKKILKYSVKGLHESQLITLLEETYRKKELPEYSGLPKVMATYKKIISLLVHDNLDEEEKKFIWEGFEEIFNYFGVENASEDIRAIRDRELRIIEQK